MGWAAWADLVLARQLELHVDPPVVDETGFSGWFEMRLEWSEGTNSEKLSFFPPCGSSSASCWTPRSVHWRWWWSIRWSVLRLT